MVERGLVGTGLIQTLVEGPGSEEPGEVEHRWMRMGAGRVPIGDGRAVCVKGEGRAGTTVGVGRETF